MDSWCSYNKNYEFDDKKYVVYTVPAKLYQDL